MFDFLKKNSKYVVWAFFVFLGLNILYGLSVFISNCSNGEDVMNIIADLFELLCSVAFLGTAVYATILKKEKMVILIFRSYFIHTILSSYFSGEYFFRYMDYSTFSSYTGQRKAYYVFLALQSLVLFCLSLLVFFYNVKKNKGIEKTSTVLGLVNVALCVIIVVLTIVLVADGSTKWFVLFNKIGNMIAACWLLLVLNHPRYLGKDKELDVTNKDMNITCKNVDESVGE